MSDQKSPDIKIHELTEGACLFSLPQGNILFGCPPEILKRILADHLPMPDTVVVPRKLHHFHSSQASLEFPLYHFLFVQRGLERQHRFQVVASPPQASGLEQMLRVTVVGPTEAEMAEVGTPPALAKELARETTFLALKNPASGKPFAIREMINFFPLDNGGRCEIYPVRGKAPAVALERLGDATFRLCQGEAAYDVDLTVTEEQEPNYPIRHTRFDKSAGRFKLAVLGRSNGFDPNDPANGYILNVDGKLVLWDCPAYLHQHLKRMGLKPGDLDALILSHVHEDHIDTSESLRDPPFELYATPEVYWSLLVKLSAVFGCSIEEAKRFHNWHKIDVTRPTELFGARWEFFHSVHAIPAIGCRVEKEVGGRRGVLYISGDHLSNAALEAMRQGKGVSRQRFDACMNRLRGDETFVLVDAGGGAIHGDFHDFLQAPGHVGFMHTGLIGEDLPKGKELVKSGQVVDILP